MSIDQASILASMTEALAAHQAQGAHQAPNSRYRDTPTAERTNTDGTTTVYLRRRFVPQPDRLTPVGRVTVSAGDRVDTLAAEVLDDPTLFWRLADANLVMRAAELVAEPGRAVRVAAPEGLGSAGD